MSLVRSLDKTTAPGVALHEYAHKKACDISGIPVVDISYFQGVDEHSRIGYVKHRVPESYTKRVLTSIAPFLMNVSVAFLLVYVPHTNFDRLWQFVLVYYLGFSSLYHGFPSYQDARSLIPQSKTGYLHPAFLIFLPLTVFLLIFTRYIDNWWISTGFAVAMLVVFSPVGGGRGVSFLTEGSGNHVP